MGHQDIYQDAPRKSKLEIVNMNTADGMPISLRASWRNLPHKTKDIAKEKEGCRRNVNPMSLLAQTEIGKRKRGIGIGARSLLVDAGRRGLLSGASHNWQ